MIATTEEVNSAAFELIMDSTMLFSSLGVVPSPPNQVKGSKSEASIARVSVSN